MALIGKKKPKNQFKLGETLYKKLSDKEKKFYKIFGNKLADSKEDHAIMHYLNNREKEEIKKYKERIL